MFQKIAAMLLSLLLLASILPAGAEDVGKNFAIQYALDLKSGEKNAQLYAMFDDTVKAQLTEEAFGAIWGQLQASFGDFVAFGDFAAKERAQYLMYELVLDMEKQDLLLTLAVTGEGKVAGLNFTLAPIPVPAAAQEAVLPDSVVEEAVTVGEGEWALPGTLTLPREGSGFPAVVLVHGSGPNNRDETVGQTKLFRDLAWKLAEKGIASLRYDKRTLVYGSSFTPDMVKEFTVEEETVIDAVLAGKTLAADSRINGAKVFLAGHSLGAMLGPRIAKAANGLFAGMVLMSGSPLQLTDIIITQNEDALAKLSEEVRKSQQPLLGAEMEKLGALASMTDEQAQEITVLGLPGYYVKDLLSYDAAATLKELKLPALIVQGGADFQVNLANGWEAWQAAAQGEDYVAMKLYPDLNHLLMKYAGDPAYQYSLQEYDTPARLDETAATDIAAWLLDQ